MSLWGYFKTKVCSNEIKDFNSAVDDYADCREEVFDLI